MLNSNDPLKGRLTQICVIGSFFNHFTTGTFQFIFISHLFPFWETKNWQFFTFFFSLITDLNLEIFFYEKKLKEDRKNELD